MWYMPHGIENLKNSHKISHKTFVNFENFWNHSIASDISQNKWHKMVDKAIMFTRFELVDFTVTPFHFLVSRWRVDILVVVRPSDWLLFAHHLLNDHIVARHTLVINEHCRWWATTTFQRRHVFIIFEWLRLHRKGHTNFHQTAFVQSFHFGLFFLRFLCKMLQNWE